jgi:hypothetical protein
LEIGRGAAIKIKHGSNFFESAPSWWKTTSIMNSKNFTVSSSGETAAFDVTVSSSAAAVIQKTGNAIDLNQSGS